MEYRGLIDHCGLHPTSLLRKFLVRNLTLESQNFLRKLVTLDWKTTYRKILERTPEKLLTFLQNVFQFLEIS